MRQVFNIVSNVYYLLVLLSFFFVSACSTLSSGAVATVDVSKTIKTKGITYIKDTDQPFTGVISAQYDGGQQRYAHHYLEGKRHGEQIEWWENGTKKVSNTYLNGKDTGGMSWYDNGQPKHQYQMEDYKMTGLSVRWYPNGQKKEEVNYINGKKEGRYLKWDEQGKVLKDINYQNGKKQE